MWNDRQRVRYGDEASGEACRGKMEGRTRAMKAADCPVLPESKDKAQQRKSKQHSTSQTKSHPEKCVCKDQ